MERQFEFLAGKKISRLSFDFAVVIELFDKSLNATIRIEQEMSFLEAGKSVVVNPGNAESAAPLLRLFGAEVKTAEAKQDGTLVVEFHQDRSLVVSPHPKYEAWELFANNGIKVVCMPGGELAIWERIARG